MTLKDILAGIASMTGRPPPRFRLPHGIVLPVACLSEGWARVAGGGEPRVTRDAARMSRKPMYFSSEKARRELGYDPRPVREALREAVDWFRRQGYIR